MSAAVAGHASTIMPSPAAASARVRVRQWQLMDISSREHSGDSLIIRFCRPAATKEMKRTIPPLGLTPVLQFKCRTRRASNSSKGLNYKRNPIANSSQLQQREKLPLIGWHPSVTRSEEHTSELQSRRDLVCR